MKYIYSKIVMFIVLWFAVFIEISSFSAEEEMIHQASIYEAQKNKARYEKQRRENIEYWKKENPNNVDPYIEWEKEATKDLPKKYEPTI